MVRQPIIGGSLSDAADSPVLFLRAPQGTCSALLVAPNLAMTARHCASQLTEGQADCDPSGNLVSNGSNAGALGADDTPSALAFYTAASVAAGNTSGTPDAVGAQIVSTQSPSVCRDDLSFVVLNQPIQGISPAAIRITGTTQVGEGVSIWGYGLTATAGDPTALRVRTDGRVSAVGPDTPSSEAQPAPVRALAIGPGSTTCSGDSGGPFLSNVTGAAIGIVSLGPTASSLSTACTVSTTVDTTGPRLAEYQDIITAAFQAANASPISETPTPSDGDAAAPPPDDVDATSSADAGIAPTDDAAIRPPPPESESDSTAAPSLDASSGCAVAVARSSRTHFDAAWTTIALAGFVTATARRRRR
jgi:V8-like Glu-specific endopeptidase